MKDHDQAGSVPTFHSDTAASQDSRILAIGDLDIWAEVSVGMQQKGEMLFTDLDDLDSAILNEVSPEIVITPVLTGKFDCLDVAGRLQQLGFYGAYRAIANGIPDKSIIRREVHSLYPMLDFDIVEVAESDTRFI